MRKRNTTVLAVTMLCSPFFAPLHSAETGDIDGDGRITLADVLLIGVASEALVPPGPPDPPIRLADRLEDLGVAEGSLAGFLDFACAGWNEGLIVPAAIYLEVLRRAVPDSLPNWWTDVWTEPVVEPPLAFDPDCVVRIEDASAAGGDSDRARVELSLVAFRPIRSFALILDTEGGLLRARHAATRQQSWNDSSWTSIVSYLEDDIEHAGGDVKVSASPADYLITRGRYVISHGLYHRSGGVEVGEHRIVVEGRLPIGTPAGAHRIEILPGSQVLFDDGTVGAPTIEAGPDIEVRGDVMVGWDGGIPPLDLDRGGRAVRGRVAFRITGAEGLPGEVVSVRVQMRTDVPLNAVRYVVLWLPEELECADSWLDSTTPLFANPEDGAPYPPRDCTSRDRSSATCGNGGFGNPARAEGQFVLVGAAPCGHETAQPERPLEYFRPLGEWIDLAEIRLRIPEHVAGGSELPLVLDPFDPSVPDVGTLFSDKPRASFVPYDAAFTCPNEFQTTTPNWRYDISYESAVVRVLGAAPGGEPEDSELGVRIVVGDAAAAPGETVAVPVFASSEVKPSTLRVALDLDSAAVSVDEVELDFVDLASREVIPWRFPRGRSSEFRVCVDENGDGFPEECVDADPVVAWFRDALDGDVIIDIVPRRSPEPIEDYPGPELREIGRLIVKVRDDFSGDATEIRPAPVRWKSGSLELRAEAGGFSLEVTDEGALRFPFSRAISATGGTIHVAPRSLRRGDFNGDGKVDLSDAVATLDYLFFGAEASRCPDAADANDSGEIAISDAIFLLGALFLGGESLPPPFPDCGPDPTTDGLGCAGGGCVE